MPQKASPTRRRPVHASLASARSALKEAERQWREGRRRAREAKATAKKAKKDLKRARKLVVAMEKKAGRVAKQKKRSATPVAPAGSQKVRKVRIANSPEIRRKVRVKKQRSPESAQSTTRAVVEDVPVAETATSADEAPSS